MRHVKSLSSLSSLAAMPLTCSSTGAAPAFITVTSHGTLHKRHSSLYTLAAHVPDTGDFHVPPAVTMATMQEQVAKQSAFSSVDHPSALFLDLPAFVENAKMEDDDYSTAGFARPTPTEVGDVFANTPLEAFIPPSKSLRQKLHLPPKHAISAAQQQTPEARLRPRVVGHRGALYQELENTRAAFLACAGDCDAVEFDVFVLPKDDSLVVFHGTGPDDNPGLLQEYCTNIPEGATSILDLTYEQTQELRFNPDFAELAAPDDRVLAGRIPTLEDVLKDIKPTGMEVKIELKGAGTAEPVVELVDRLGMANQVSFSSFNHKEIETVRKMRPQMNSDGTYVYKTGALFGEVPVDYIQRAQRVGASEVHLQYDTCTSDRVKEIHDAGMGSMAWFRGPVGMKADTTDTYWDIGNEDESCYETLIETGVQQLCVNKPDVLAKLLRSKEEQLQKQSDSQPQTQFVKTIRPSELGPLEQMEQPIQQAVSAQA